MQNKNKKNEENELIGVIKGKGAVIVSVVTNIDADVNFIARDSYNPTRKIMGMLLDCLILIIVEHPIILNG